MKKLLITIALGLISFASYGDYELHQLTDPASSVFQDTRSVVLNNEGEVAFLANSSVYTTALGIGPTVLYGPDLVRPNGQRLTIDSTGLDINDFGEVVFGAETFLESAGIYSGDGGAITEHIYTDSGFLGGATINNLGNVAFVGDPSGFLSNAYFSDGESVNEIGGSLAFNETFGAAINEANDVVVSGFFLDLGPQVIYTSSGVTIIDDADSGLSNFGVVSWNSSGLVAFSALSEGSFGLFTSDGDVTTQIAEDILISVSGIAINESGDLAFVDPVSDTLYFFSSSDGSVVPVVSDGDIINGRVVSSISLDRNGFNDLREIAFRITFTDGDNGVYFARPVPAPAAIILFLSALGFFGIFRKRTY